MPVFARDTDIWNKSALYALDLGIIFAPTFFKRCTGFVKIGFSTDFALCFKVTKVF